jgi:hypothetical protein
VLQVDPSGLQTSDDLSMVGMPQKPSNCRPSLAEEEIDKRIGEGLYKVGFRQAWFGG